MLKKRYQHGIQNLNVYASGSKTLLCVKNDLEYFLIIQMHKFDSKRF